MARDPYNPFAREKERETLRRGIIDAEGNSIPTYENGALVNPVAPPPPKSTVQRMGGTLRREASAAVDTFGAPFAVAASGIRNLPQVLEESVDTYVNRRDMADAPTKPASEVQFMDPDDLLATQRDVYRATDPEGGRSTASGLTRIVKTADGTYIQTSDPNVKGESRIYDALGNRADRNADITGARDVRDSYRIEQAAPDRMDTAGGREKIMQQGKDSLARLDRLRAEGAQREQLAMLAALSPDARRQIISDANKEAGLDRRHAQTLQVQREGQQAAQMQAQTANAKALLEQNNLERAKYSEDPQAYMQQAMAELANLTPDEQVKWLANPNNPRASLVRSAFSQLTQQRGLGDDPTKFTEASGLRRFLHSPLTFGASAPRYDSNNGMILDDLFDPEDLGVSKERLDTLIRSAAQVNSRR